VRTPLGERIDLVGRRPLWFSLSAALIIVGLFFWGARGLNKGIDFTGGTVLKYETVDHPIVGPGAQDKGDLASAYGRIRTIVQDEDIGKYTVRLGRDGRFVHIRTSAQTDEEAEKQLDAVGGAMEEAFGTTLTKTRDIVGPVIGRELGLNAIKALILGLVLILIFVSWRYEFRFAVAAIIALAHDVLVLVGVFAITQREIDSSFVPVLLTVVGYSINDTIVIFDRIRENVRLYRREPFDAVVNASLWQTMARSINTTLTTLFTLIMLYFFGGATIHDFAFGLIVGITCGAYSSIFVASPVVVAWRELRDRRQAAAAAFPPRVSPAPARQRPPPAAPEAGAAADMPVGSQASAGTSAQPAGSGTAAPAQKRKKKRKGASRIRRRRF